MLISGDPGYNTGFNIIWLIRRDNRQLQAGWYKWQYNILQQTNRRDTINIGVIRIQGYNIKQ